MQPDDLRTKLYRIKDLSRIQLETEHRELLTAFAMLSKECSDLKDYAVKLEIGRISENEWKYCFPKYQNLSLLKLNKVSGKTNRKVYK